MQWLVSRGTPEHILAGAVAQKVLVETEVVMPAGQELEGMQKVSTVDSPGSMVMLYHWSLAQEQETALKISGISASLSTAGQIEQGK